jgi:hypothetical protein
VLFVLKYNTVLLLVKVQEYWDAIQAHGNEGWIVVYEKVPENCLANIMLLKNLFWGDLNANAIPKPTKATIAIKINCIFFINEIYLERILKTVRREPHPSLTKVYRQG